MPWLYFALALVALAVAFQTTSMALLVVCLLVGLALIIAGVVNLFARRLDHRSRDESLMLDPEELRRLREQAEARKVAAGQSESPH